MRFVWGGQNSLRLALKNNNLSKKYKIYTFDICKSSNNFKNIVIDLSSNQIIQLFNKLIKQKKIKKPDYIISSPNCQSFSLAMQSISNIKDSTGKFISGNPHRFFNKEINKVCFWPKNKDIYWNGFSGNSYPNGYKSVPKYISELGNRCIENNIKLICYFKPKCWYIENPARSLIFKYIKYNLKFDYGIENIAYYSSYSFNHSRKPTCFLSNINLVLKKTNRLSLRKINENNYELILSGACRNNITDEIKRMNAENKIRKELKNDNIQVKLKYLKNAMERSKIPDLLIIDILNKFDKYIQDCSFKKNKYKINFNKLTKYSSNEKINIKKMVKEKII